MDSLKIGKYIQFLRKQKGLSQKELADKLNISFQAVSKWENGESLPDIGVLLDLAFILDTTTDKILNGGNILLRKSKKINIANIKEGLNALEDMKIFFGENSTFYRGAIEGINAKMNIDIEEYLKDEYTKEVLLSEAIIQYLMNGYIIDDDEIENEIKSEHMKNMIRKYVNN